MWEEKVQRVLYETIPISPDGFCAPGVVLNSGVEYWFPKGILGLQEGRKVGLPSKISHAFQRTTVRNLVHAGVPDKLTMEMTCHKTRSLFGRPS